MHLHLIDLSVIVIVLGGIGLLLDVYVYMGLKTLTNDWKSPWLRRLVIFGCLAPDFIITVLCGFFTHDIGLPKVMGPFYEWILSLFLTFLVTKLVFALVLFIGDSGRFFKGIIRHFKKPKTKKTAPFFPARRKFISQAAVAAAAVPFGSLFYAMLKGKYNFKLHKQEIYFDDLPDAFDGFTITQISDIHSGSFDNAEAVQRGINLAKAQKSDLFVFTGDLVNGVSEEIVPYLKAFSELKAPFGQFSILGNHDYGEYVYWRTDADKAADCAKLRDYHKTLGYRLLLDENVVVEKNGQKISLIGVQNWGRGFIQIGDLDKALIGVPEDAFKILLSHDPTHWEEKVRFHPNTIQLTLSGHTHGAQFGVETSAFRWSPFQYRYLDWAGLANEKNRYLYVNRGFGFLAFSGRLGIWPEVTVITLRKKGKAADQ